jgi:hypothetical protein
MNEKNTSAEKHARWAPERQEAIPQAGIPVRTGLETMALACGKIRATQPLCRFNRKNS